MKSPLRFNTWVIPLSYAVIAVAAGMVFPRLETPIFHGLGSTVTVSAAMAIYSSVASGMLALTAVVFSLAFVMIQFSAIEKGSSKHPNGMPHEGIAGDPQH